MSRTRKTKRIAVVLAALAVTATLGAGTVLALGATGSQAGEETAQRPGGEDKVAGMEHAPTVQDSYVVVFEDTVSAEAVGVTAADLARKHGATITTEYSSALTGFAMHATAKQAERLAQEPTVKYVQPNQQISIDGA
ncbi:protease inhibitor I9 family protein [Allosaccharopolyspora coralli]|uniref:protease inhibitor I9 family protein n=1 Tax=Allosaccharopolyspora coralli TaxID=2665642 RepID=UPI0016527072|nr:protease inhibitor I9 family protein [Allosaccharopolyspora coralli]